MKGALETVPVGTLGFGHGVGPKREQPAQAHCLLGGLQVVTVDVKNKKVVFKDGFKLEYSKLLLAPGSRWGLHFALCWESVRMGEGCEESRAPHESGHHVSALRP